MGYLWRAIDAEGEVLDILAPSERNKNAALKLMRKLLKKYGFVPDRTITDDLQSRGAAAYATNGLGALAGFSGGSGGLGNSIAFGSVVDGVYTSGSGGVACGINGNNTAGVNCGSTPRPRTRHR